MPEVGRYTGVDPLANKFAFQSTYSYTGNNPIINIDVQGKYKFPAVYANTYKRLAAYLKNNVHKDIMGSPHILQWFLKYSNGNLTPDVVSTATTWDDGSTIEVVDLPDGIYGHFDNQTGVIKISNILADQLENASPEDIQAALYGVFVTLTHETVHYGDYLDGVGPNSDDGTGYGGEPGIAFMHDVFYSSDVKVGNKTERVYNSDLDPNKIEDAKIMIYRNKEDGRSDQIPTCFPDGK